MEETPKSLWSKIKLEPIIKQSAIFGTPKIVRKLLAPLDSLEFDSVSNSSSDLTDPLYEVTKDNIYSKKEEIKHLSRNEINQKLVDGFTDKFKKTVADVRQEMKLDDYLYAERKEDIFKSFNTPIPEREPSESAKKKRADALGEIISLKVDPETLSAKESEMSYNYMSGIWTMMKANTTDPVFKITPREFNVYEQGTPYWLEYPRVAPKKVEVAKEKCTLWLSKHHI